MYEQNWAVGDRLKYLDKNNQWGYGTVVSVYEDKVYATLDGYPRGVKGCFRIDSPHVTKVKNKRKGGKYGL